MTTAPADHIFVHPLHLAGRGNPGFGPDLVTHFGWRVPSSGDGDILLTSPDAQAHLTWRPGPARWEVTAPSPHWPRARWSAVFDDRAPAEITSSFLYALAHALEHEPQEVLYAPSGHDAALGVLRQGGWTSGQRDGHEVLLAPDRLAVLTRPLGTDDAPTVLTGTGEQGTWTVQFGDRTPALLLQAAAATLLRPAVRHVDEVPAAHRGRLSAQPVAQGTAHRALVSPRRLAGPGTGADLLPEASALWHRTRPGRLDSSCGRARIETPPGGGVRVSAGPDGPGQRLAWTAEFTGAVPPEIASAWLDSLTDSLAADIDLGTGASFGPGPGASIGDALRPLTSAGWNVHTDDADLHLVAPDGHTTARITHGLLTPATTTDRALAHTAHWGASVDCAGAPGHRWRAAVSSLTPLHLVGALAVAVTDPAPVPRRLDRIPAQYRAVLRAEAAERPLSQAARATLARTAVRPAARPAVVSTAPAAGPTPASRLPGR
ncbi:DUF317 domain-containing protein [Kitasatospora sp. NPDC058032]|uniref:DUF317 domain-containing protein n=1 Tax=Kitasatospora sp. NPDC058032 TaxID=3346307 RepID=UPI0036DEB92C